jgi:choice-of-anchor A domain-containing protein
MSSLAVSHANASSLGVAGDYNLIALTGSINYSGPDIQGRVAAYDDITFNPKYGNSTTLGTYFKNKSSSDYTNIAEAGGTISTKVGDYIVVDGTGNADSGTKSSSTYYFNSGGSLTSGWSASTSTLSTSTTTTLSTLDTYLKALSLQYSKMSNTGTVVSSGNQTTLKGTSSTLNVFTVTAAEFSSTKLVIDVPTGSTVIINVVGCDTTACSIYATPEINGSNEGRFTSGNLLFNFPDATSLTIDSELDGTILAPDAALSGDAELSGVVLVASANVSGEIDYSPATGNFPSLSSVPEPGTLGLLGTGILTLAGLIRRRKQS